MRRKRLIPTRKANKSSYHVSRFNALKHGILSKVKVLPWENQQEYDALHAAYLEEHRPVGPTQAHLVEELAGIEWRQRRLRLAEAAAYRSGLKRALEHMTVFPWGDSPIATFLSAAKAEPIEDNILIFTDIIYGDPRELTEKATELRPIVEGLENALAILWVRTKDTYDRALRSLEPLIRECWQHLLETSSGQSSPKYTPTAESLLDWLKTEAYPFLRRGLAALDSGDAFREQAFGDSFEPDRLEKLARYETHLDRKYERILAILLKLQQLRHQNETNDQVTGESR